VADDTIRIFSDLHYGDRSSQVRSLAQIGPLLDGPGRIVVNGDTLDTRQGPHPELTAALREEVRVFFARYGGRVTLMTGNHDPDLSSVHRLDLAGGQVFVLHGDVLYDEIVPWGNDAPVARARIAAARAALPPSERNRLDSELAIFRAVAATLPQRHQVEPNRWKHLLSFINDTFWPPLRILRILQAWRRTPLLAASFAATHRPQARFVITGHFHRPGVWRPNARQVVINTGSFCPPLGACLVDVSRDRLIVRRIVRRRGEFHAGQTMAEFALAPG
jgi:UDP-2,3-diacylglucosamine pyrophosphatase LpxH